VRSTRVIAVSLAVLGLSAAPALATDPAQDGYNAMPIAVPPSQSQSPQVEGASVTNSPAAASAPVAATTRPTSAGSSLPFTGLDVGIVAAVAVLLLGLGFALRRGTRAEA
jgi:hypothetical protein